MISEEAARERAERMFETGSYAGIDAYTVTGNTFIGEYGEPDLYSHVLPGLQKEAVMQWDETFERLVEGGFTKDLQNHMVASE